MIYYFESIITKLIQQSNYKNNCYISIDNSNTIYQNL